MTEINQYGLVRTIPEGVQRLVRQRCGFGCVLCGDSFCVYDHSDPPFVEAREHLSEAICLLCHRHNRMKESGRLSVEEIKEANQHPKAIEDGFSNEPEFRNWSGGRPPDLSDVRGRDAVSVRIVTSERVQIGGPAGSLTVSRAGQIVSSADRVTWTLEVPGLRATDEVMFADWDGGPGLLATFFTDLATDWRGWEGAREWTGGGGEVHLAATHDGVGHVVLWVTMRAHWHGSPPYPDEWTASAALALEPGSLGETARRISELLGVAQRPA